MVSKSSRLTSQLIFLLFLLNMENYETKTGRKRCPRAPHHATVRAHPWLRRHVVWAPRSPSPTRFHPVPSFCYETFRYIIPRIPRAPYIVFSLCFCFDLFLTGIVLSFRSTMVSANNDKGKEPLEDDLQDPKLEEEVESEAEGEVEEDPRAYPRATIWYGRLGARLRPVFTWYLPFVVQLSSM